MTDRRSRTWPVNLLISFIATVLALLMAEWISRVIIPVEAGSQFLRTNGQSGLYLDPFHLQPNAVFRQLSGDFDAEASTTALGHRSPAPSGPPELVFIGDSFTFGLGLNDNQTFASLHCSQKQIQCANLGTPGTGTVIQAGVLEAFLAEQAWRPREVILTMYVSTKHLFHGNDLVDNMAEASTAPGRESAVKTAQAASIKAASPNVIFETLVNLRNIALRHSNLARLVYYRLVDQFRSKLLFDIEADFLSKALNISRASLMKIHGLSSEFGFALRILIMPPLADMSSGAHIDSAATIASIAPVPVESLGPILATTPGAFYFPADGHLNEAGAALVAQYLTTTPAPGQTR